MASTIVDVARETARRALLAGDIDTAEKAATTGLTACAEQFHEESLWRYLIRCAWAHADTQTLDQRINDLNTILTEQDADLEPETGQLPDEITTARRHGPATGRPAAI